MRYVERSCQDQIDAMAAQTPLVFPPKAVLEKAAHLFNRNVRRPYGILEWYAHKMHCSIACAQVVLQVLI